MLYCCTDIAPPLPCTIIITPKTRQIYAMFTYFKVRFSSRGLIWNFPRYSSTMGVNIIIGNYTCPGTFLFRVNGQSRFFFFFLKDYRVGKYKHVYLLYTCQLYLINSIVLLMMLL